MRFLICPGGGYGNLHPLVPLAHALAAGGHVAAFAASPGHHPTIRRLGFEAFGIGPEAGIDGIVTTERAAELGRLDAMARAARVVDSFAELAEASIPDLAAVIEQWRPDVLVRDTTAFAAWIAGDLAGLPVALFDFGGIPPSVTAKVAGPRLNQLREAFGLPADETLDSTHRWLVLVGAPPCWIDLDRLPPTVHLLQPPEFDRATIESRPGWLDTLPASSPVVYATLGTVFGDSPQVWKAIFAAAAQEPDIILVATIGPATDATRLGTIPPNVRVEPYVPQSWLLDAADAVIAHGGYGTLMGALRRGKPIVCLPMPAADNPLNAARMSTLGAGLVIPENEPTAISIGHALHRILNEPAFRQAANKVAAAIAGLPDADHGAILLERLASQRQPISRSSSEPSPGT